MKIYSPTDIQQKRRKPEHQCTKYPHQKARKRAENSAQRNEKEENDKDKNIR